MMSLRVPAALLVLTALSIAAPAHAYVHELDRYGARIKWPAPHLTVRIDASAQRVEGIKAALALAASAYDTLRTDEKTPATGRSELRFVIGPQTQPDAEAHVVIKLRTPPPKAARFLAITEVQTGRAGVAVRATIWLNETLPMSLHPKPTEADLVSVLVHELGHAAGLGHSRDRRAAMHGGVHNGERAHRTLKEDDIRGITALYQPGGAARAPLAAPAKAPPKSPASRCDCIMTRATPPATMGFALVAGALFCGRGRKRRRRVRTAPGGAARAQKAFTSRSKP